MEIKRAPVFTLTKDDFRVEYYTAGGPGGGGKDTSNTACRITHKTTGIAAECQVHRSQLQNKKQAFQRLVDKMKPWIKAQHAQKLGLIEGAEKWVEGQMNPDKIKIEVKDEKGKWTLWSGGPGE